MRTRFGLGIVTAVQEAVPVIIHFSQIMHLHSEYSWLRLQPMISVLLASRYFIMFLSIPSSLCLVFSDVLFGASSEGSVIVLLGVREWLQDFYSVEEGFYIFD